MEVTRSNLEELLPEIEQVISDAQFLAVDGEFTGLNSGESIFPYDTPARQYAKLRKSMDFLLVQFGLCAFQYDQHNKYTHRAYNFYIFPRQLNHSAADPRFLCQSSSINFLVSHGFDFNKLFKEGIPYMTQSEEQRQRDGLRELELLLGSTQQNEHVRIPDNLQDTVNHLCGLVADFIANDKGEELKLPNCNGFVRKLVHQSIQQLFPAGEVLLESRQVDGGDSMLVALRAGSAEELRRLQELSLQKKQALLEESLGFSKVIKLISHSGKLVVGHNMLLDLCHTLHQFVAPLPYDYLQFKEMANFVFPRVLDTKFMSATSPFKDIIGVNILQNLYTTLCEEPFSMPVVETATEGFGYTIGEDKCHEAAYDAFVTGLCFISMANYLGSSTQLVLQSSTLLKPYVNKLNLLRSVDTAYISLSGNDPEVSTSHVFYVSFPMEWKTSDLSELFSPFGPVQIWWVSEVSAWVALLRPDQARVVTTTLNQSDRYALVTYLEYQQHEDMCECSAVSARDILLCLKRTSVHSKCSPAVLKRRAHEPVSISESQTLGSDSPKRKCSHSFGECRFSNRSIATIPEEQDEEKEDSTADGNGSEETSNMPNSSASTKDAIAKQFAECDTWD